MKKERYHELDFLRFLAAFSVLLFHYVFRVWNLEISSTIEYPLLSIFAKYGYLGVDAFFMISGFVILLSADGRSASQFVISRIVRLFPAYWFCVVVIFVFAKFWPLDTYSVTYFDFLINLTMLQSLFSAPHVSTIFWTIVIELQFYFFIFLVIQTKQLSRLNYILATWLIISMACDYFAAPMWFQKLVISNWSHYFIAGSLFYLIRKQGLSVFKVSMLLLCLWQALRHGYWYVLLKQRLSGIEYEPNIVSLFIIFTFLFFLLVAYRRVPGKYEKLAKLGVLTYPLYLIHGLIGETFMLDGISHINKYVLFIAVTILMVLFSYLIHVHIENRYALKLKKKLNYMNDNTKKWFTRVAAR